MAPLVVFPFRRRAPPVHPGYLRGGGAGGAIRALQTAAPALLLLGALLPADRPVPFDLCLWHRLTGLRCLGCGLTRSVCHLLQGDVAGSLALHPAGVVVVAILALLAMRGALEAARGLGLRIGPMGRAAIR